MKVAKFNNEHTATNVGNILFNFVLLILITALIGVTHPNVIAFVSNVFHALYAAAIYTQIKKSKKDRKIHVGIL